MNAHEPIGYLASLLVLTTFCMRDMPTLRLVAIASNLAFISYGLLAEIGPVLLLHTLLLPINLYRLVQALRHQGQPGNPEKEGSIRANTHTQQLQALGRPAGLQVKEVSMQKRFSLIPALTVLALMAGCTPNQPPPPPPSDTTPPSIVSITPNPGAIGVAKDVKIVIDFSEAMNRQATELAYQSADLPAVTFAWSNGDTRLEIDPVGDLEYTSAGKVYSFKLGNSATDLAGNKLAPVNSSFTTFRELTRTLTSMAALDGSMTSHGFKGQDPAAGDGPEALHVRGFLSFDLGSLETDGLAASTRITSVVLRAFQQEIRGTPYQSLSANGRYLVLAHVLYGSSLEAADFNTAILRDLGDLSSDDLVGYKASPNALEAVRDDWTNRASRGNRSQFMLYFPRNTDGDPEFDYVLFSGGESVTNPPQLEVKFLVP